MLKLQNFPKLEKYLSLYPSQKEDSATAKGKQKATAESSETETKREVLRASIRDAMEKGELSSEPELLTLSAEGKGVASQEKKKAPDLPTRKAKGGVRLEDDDFFAGDSD